MAKNRSVVDNESDILGDHSFSLTDNVRGMEEIELVRCRIGETNDEDSEIVLGTEAAEEDGSELNQVRDLIPRTGPQVRDYLAEFFTYVRNRFEYRPNVFYAPIELQATMERMESARIPVPLWKAFLNASTNLLSKIGIEFDKHQFLDILIFILTIISEFFIKNIILQMVVLILGCVGAKLLAKIITTIYEFIISSFRVFWEYVKKKLRYYSELSTKYFKEYKHP